MGDSIGRVLEEKAKTAYAAYFDSAEGRDRGSPMPKWEDLPAPMRAHWRAAVAAILPHRSETVGGDGECG